MDTLSPPILIELTPAVEVPTQLIATTEYSYTVLILSCALSIVPSLSPLNMSVPSRYTRYASIGMSASEIDQLILVLEQLLLGCEIVTRGEEGTIQLLKIQI